jgi:hypothetical protein
METLKTILDLPERCLVGKKITKAFFKRNFDLTTAEKTLLEDSTILVGIDWIASISHTSTNIVGYLDDSFLYEEVQVISIETTVVNFDKNSQRIADLIQKYIPYPILLCVWCDSCYILNTCDKRVNQNDKSRRTVDKSYYTELIAVVEPTERQKAFLKSLPFGELDKSNLKSFYDSYTQRIIALLTAQIDGQYKPRTQIRTKADLDNLEKIEALEKEIVSMQNQAKKESQLNLQVSLNTQIQMKRKQIKKLKELIIA